MGSVAPPVRTPGRPFVPCAPAPAPAPLLHSCSCHACDRADGFPVRCSEGLHQRGHTLREEIHEPVRFALSEIDVVVNRHSGAVLFRCFFEEVHHLLVRTLGLLAGSLDMAPYVVMVPGALGD